MRALQSQQAAQQAVPAANQMGYVNDAVPDSSTLLAYKLLKDSIGPTNSGVFQDMLEIKLKYLLGGIAILKNDSKISTEMGGETMANAAKLAQVLKNEAKKMDYEDRIKNTAADLLYHEYSKPGKIGMAPGRMRSSFLAEDANHNVTLQYRISGATNRGIRVNTANGIGNNAFPAIANRNFLHANAAAAPQVSAVGAFRQRFGNPFGFA